MSQFYNNGINNRAGQINSGTPFNGLNKTQLRIHRLIQEEANKGGIKVVDGNKFLKLLPGYKTRNDIQALIGHANRSRILPNSDEFLAKLEIALLPDELHESFNIKRILGKGAMGAVYAAENKNTKRNVAIKTILGNADLESISRFQREAEAVAKLRHPAIAQIHTLKNIEGNLYLVHQLIEGKDLKKEINELYKNGAHKVDEDRKIELLEALVQVARGLATAHKQGIAHRDLKPENIMYDSNEERAYLMDFGLVKVIKKDGQNPLFSRAQTLTHDGAILGTPMFMAPEQMQALPDTDFKKVDIFALGAILNRILTGQYHVQGNSLVALCRNLELNGPILPQTIDSEIPNNLHNIVAKALSKDPNKRQASAEEFADSLEEAIKENYYPETEKPKPSFVSQHAWKLLATTGLAVPVAGGLTYLSLCSDPEPTKIRPKKRRPRIRLEKPKTKAKINKPEAPKAEPKKPKLKEESLDEKIAKAKVKIGDKPQKNLKALKTYTLLGLEKLNKIDNNSEEYKELLRDLYDSLSKAELVITSSETQYELVYLLCKVHLHQAQKALDVLKKFIANNDGTHNSRSRIENQKRIVERAYKKANDKARAMMMAGKMSGFKSVSRDQLKEIVKAADRLERQTKRTLK